MSRMRIALAIGAAVLVAAGCKDKEAKTNPTQGTAGSPRAAEASHSPSSAAHATGDPISEQELARAVAERRLDHWYGLYLGGKKVGYARVEARPSEKGEPGGYMAGLEVMFVADGEELHSTERTYYEAAPPFRLVELQTAEHMSSSDTERRYVADGDRLVVHSKVDGKTQPERELPRTAETLAAFVAPFPDPNTAEKGQRITYVDFEVDDEEDKQSTTTVTEIRTQRISGVETRVAVVEERSEGEQTVSETLVASGGVALSVNIGGLDLKLEDKAVAQSNVKGFDIFADAVAVDRDLGEPSDVRELHLVATIDQRFQPPSGPNQQVSKRPDGRLDVVIRSLPGKPVTAEERTEALASTHEIDWKAPAVTRAAAEITKGAKSDREKVGKLISWVYESLDKNLTSNVATASQVLARKAGDCTEHALLFAALARAQGIPARLAGGLVYMGDELRRFGWHQWNEVALDGHWVQVDPSWDEEIANATHFLLGSGSTDDSIMAIGNMKLELAGPE